MLSFICPHDSNPLTIEETCYLCNVCGRRYPIDFGVIRFLEQDNDFYEGTYEGQIRFIPRSERLWHVWPLWLINSGYPWIVRQYVPKGSTVVELGCAGGVHYFGSRYRMIGCDLSFSALQKLDNIYEALLQADAARCLPILDNSVDAVVSSYFWEHIPPDVKPPILDEIKRILRPGGKLIFLYDVETKNPLISYFKKKAPILYRRLFIEGDGHLGYQSPQENLKIFNEKGFQLVKHQGMDKTWLQSPSVYTKLALFGTGSSLLTLLSQILQHPKLYYIYTASMRLSDTLLCSLLPNKWARIDLVVFKKKA